MLEMLDFAFYISTTLFITHLYQVGPDIEVVTLYRKKLGKTNCTCSYKNHLKTVKSTCGSML